MSRSPHRPASPDLPQRGPEPPQAADIVIVGAGIIGLAIGWRLAAAGRSVVALDRGDAGREASWAAAGMLAAGLEAEPGERPLTDLNLRARDMWPAFAAELGAASGIDVGFRDEGTLRIALTRDDAAHLRDLMSLQQRLGLTGAEWLSGADVRAREPRLSARTIAGVFFRADTQVDNRLATAALARAFAAAGGALVENCPVDAVETAAGRIAGVVAAGGRRIAAPTVVLAAGAWSRGIGGLDDADLPPVRPVKGQMLALGMDPADPLIRHLVWAPGTYLVPRRDGRLIVGATVEEKGFDRRLTGGGVFALLEGAWRALPAIEEAPILETWTGLRPGSRDDAPILGMGRIPGLVYATGHHRNGILLAPVTAQIVARLILGLGEDPALAAFALSRFEATAA